MEFQKRKKNNKGIRWTSSEEDKLVDFIKNDEINYDTLQTVFENKTLQAIRNKIRKLRISKSLYGASYQEDKETFTLKLAFSLKPQIVFEAYAGIGVQSIRWGEVAKEVYSSEINKNKFKDFKNCLVGNDYKCYESSQSEWTRFSKNKKKIWFANIDAVKAASILSAKGKKVDVLDLDTCGTSLPTLPIFLSLLKPKYVVITHGEFHSLRFRREDVLRRILPHIDISKPILPITPEGLAQELDKAVKLYALRSHNQTIHSYWAELIDEQWLGPKGRGMLRRVYALSRPSSTAECLNFMING